MKKFIVNNTKKLVSKLKDSTNQFRIRIKSRVKMTKETFRKNLAEAKGQPVSKRKSALLGFSMVLTIFGITMVTPLLPAVAKDIPKSKPGEITPAPGPGSSGEIQKHVIKGLGGFAAAVCAGAAQTGSFALGIICGIAVVVGMTASRAKKN